MPAVTPKSAIKTDPELLRQIDAAQSSETPIVGIFRLRPEDTTKLINSHERTNEIVKEVFGRVEKKVGAKPQRLNVLRNLGVVVVSAAPSFISELLKQPEIFSAMANQRTESGKIEPISKRPVSESAIDTPVNGRSKSKPATAKSKAAGKKAAKKR